MFQLNALVNATTEPAVSQIETATDVLIINDAHKFAYFGWYMASQMPSTGWDLLNRTLVWATSYTLPNETKIVFFTEPDDEDAAAVYDWLASAGYLDENIEEHPTGDAGTLPSTHYYGFNLVLYWNVEGVNSTNIAASGVPFITVSAPQTADMGIGTGNYTTYEEKDVFHIVNNNYYPTQLYPCGPLLFESAIGADATEATTGGKVLVKAEVESVGPQVEMSLIQDVNVSDNGSANMTLTFNIPEGPLAELYLESFFTEPPTDPGVEVPVPENKTEPVTAELEEGVVDTSLTGDINGDGIVSIVDVVIAAVAFGTRPGSLKWNPGADLNPDFVINIVDLVIIGANFGAKRPPPPEVTLPVREVFHQGVVIEQSALLGFETVIVDSKVLPRGVNNETQISLNFYAPQLAKLNSSNWRIKVGPQDEEAVNASGEFTLTKIQFIEQYLHKLPGDQVYLNNWKMRIKLPAKADFLNREALDGLKWTVDFGGGTYMESNLTATEKEVVVEEKMKVTEQEITATEEYLQTAFSQYKVFKIEYNLSSSSGQIESVEEPCTLGSDWEGYWSCQLGGGTWTLHWPPYWPPILRKFYGPPPGDIKVTVRPKVHIGWYLGWHLHGLSPQWFETYVYVYPTIDVSVDVCALRDFQTSWSRYFATFEVPVKFSVGIWRYNGHIRLRVHAGFTVWADEGKVSASVSATGFLKADVKWERKKGWKTTFEYDLECGKTGPTIHLPTGLRIDPWCAYRLSFEDEVIGGPWFEVRSYARIVFTYPTTWSIKLGLVVYAGVWFRKWLKWLLKLDNWSTRIAHVQWLKVWP